MKIKLEFTEADQDLRLSTVSFWRNKEAEKPDARLHETSYFTNSNTNVVRFSWQASIRAFCVLMLEAYVKNPPDWQPMTGGKGSLARSLVELLGDTETKGSKPTWAQLLFGSVIDSKIDPRVPQRLFVRSSNSSTNFFRAALGPAWRKAEINVMLSRGGGNESRWYEVEVTPDKALDLIQRLRAQHGEPAASQRIRVLTGQLDVMAWHPDKTCYLALENSPVPLPLKCGVQIHVELSSPGFPCVLWINSAGEIQPLYPWRDFDWHNICSQSALTSLSLPEAHLTGDTGFYPLNSKPGVEIALLLASQQPIAKSALCDLKSELQNIPCEMPETLPEPARIYRLPQIRKPTFRGSPTRLGKPHITNDPLVPLARELHELVGDRFGVITGQAFTTCKGSGKSRSN